MKKYTLLLILALFSFEAISQSIPGYMGKRFSVAYYAYTFPTFLNPTNSAIRFNDAGESDPKRLGFSFSYQHHLMFEYTLSKEYSIIADLNYTRTFINALYGNYSIDNAEIYEFEDFPTLSAPGFSVGLRNYSKHFAPLGAYVEYRLGYTHLDIGDFEYLKNGLAEKVMGTTSSGLLFGMGIGTKRVIADKVIIDAGIEFAAFSKGWKNSSALLLRDGPEHQIGFNSYWSQTDEDKTEALKKLGEGRFFIHSLINFRLGIGLLH